MMSHVLYYPLGGIILELVLAGGGGSVLVDEACVVAGLSMALTWVAEA